MPKTPPTLAGKLLEIPVAAPGRLWITGRTLSVVVEPRIRRFDIDNGKELKPLPAGDLLLAVSRDRSLKWSKHGVDVTDLDGKVKASLEGLGTEIPLLLSNMSMDRDGKYVSGRLGPTSVVWDARTGKAVFKNDKLAYARVDVSPAGTHVAIGRESRPLMLVSTKDWSISEVPDAKIKTLCYLAWSPDGAQLVMHSYTQAIVVDVKARKVVAGFKLLHAYSCAFVPGHDVFLAGSGRRISIWDSRTWKPRGEVAVCAPRLVVTDDGDRIITGSDDPPITVWDTAHLLGAGKHVPKRPKSARPAKRKVRAIFFGVRKRVPEKKIIHAVGLLHSILDREPPGFAVRILLADKTRDRHWFHIVGTRGRNYLLSPWIECLQDTLNTPLDVVMHSDVTKKVEGRRYSTPYDSTPIRVAGEYLGALDVANPVLLIQGGRWANKRVKPSDISSLVSCVELCWPYPGH
ncbi:MAG: repeat-like protein [Myxococcales bacterium]|nr:repeat-like protein [Myxococcales bacterium]